VLVGKPWNVVATWKLALRYEVVTEVSGKKNVVMHLSSGRFVEA